MTISNTDNTMKKEIEIKIPSPPNFILVGKTSTNIRYFTDDELRQIGQEWTEQLIEKAHKRRTEPEID